MASPLLPYLTQIPLPVLILLAIVGFIICLLVIKLFYPKLFSQLWFIARGRWIKIPFRKSRMVKQVVKAELENSKKGSRYTDFKEFLKDCPEYQIESGTIASMIRNLMRGAGARYQQYVFIDKSAPKDKTAYLRREGDLVLHEKGTYCLPWDSEKEIIYFDIHDMRPLIDKTKEMEWENPDMCADVVTSITNAHGMGNMGGGDGNSKYVLIGLVLTVVVLILVGAVLYQNIEAQKTTLAAINAINQSIPRI